MTVTKPQLPHDAKPRGRQAPDQGRIMISGPRGRRRLLLWSAVPAVLVLGIAGKLLSLGVFAGQAAGAFDARDAGAAEAASGRLQPLNIVEPYKAPFAAGDAKVLAGDFDAARQRFSEALGLVPEAAAGSSDACVIRVNLVLATERLGDAKMRAEDPSSAVSLFSEALAVAKAAPQGCFPDSSGPSEGTTVETGDRLGNAAERLSEKLDTAGRAADAGGGSEGNADPAEEDAQSPGQSQLEQLEESAQQSQRERNSGREREEYLNDTGYAQAPDRPW